MNKIGLYAEIGKEIAVLTYIPQRNKREDEVNFKDASILWSLNLFLKKGF